MEVSDINELILHYAEEFVNIAQENHNLKYNETISVCWIIFRIMNHFNDPKIIQEIKSPNFNELCILLNKSIIGENYKNDLNVLIEKLEIQVNLPETIIEFYDKLSGQFKTEMFIHPNQVLYILQKCIQTAGTRRKISKRR